MNRKLTAILAATAVNFAPPPTVQPPIPKPIVIENIVAAPATKFEGEVRMIKDRFPVTVNKYSSMSDISKDSIAFFNREGEMLLEIKYPINGRGVLRVRDSLMKATGDTVYGVRGIKEHFERNVESNGPYVHTIQDIYQWNRLPRQLTAHLLTESNLNPLARSRTRRGAVVAEGICQVHRRNNAWARTRINEFAYSPYDMFGEAGLCSGILQGLYKKHGSYFVALSEFHTGAGNIEKVLADGEDIAGESLLDRLEVYLLGAPFTRKNKVRGESFGRESLEYTPNVVGRISDLDGITNSVPQEEVHAYKSRITTNLNTFASRNNIDITILRDLNPHLRNGIKPGVLVYTNQELNENDYSFWRKETPTLDSVWAEWDSLQWDNSSEEEKLAIAAKFKAAGNPFMDFGIRYAMITPTERSIENYRNQPSRMRNLARFLQ